MIQYDSSKWWLLLFQILPRHGSVLPGILTQIMLVAALAIMAPIILEEETDGDSKKFRELPDDAHSLLGPPLAFLLVFRSQLSYNRYWEGRGHIGTVAKDVRDMARQVCYFFDSENPSGVQARNELLRYLKLFYALLRMHLRGESDINDATLLNPSLVKESEKNVLQHCARRPLVVVGWMSAIVTRMRGFEGTSFSTKMFVHLDDSVSDLIAGFNGCDKIRGTPIPFPYAQMLVIFLTLYIFTLPFVLVQYFEYVTIVPSVIMCIALFGINQVGLEIEDPFGYDSNDLPLDAIGNALSADIDSFLANSRGTVAVSIENLINPKTSDM
eukprot:Rmarinus@m.10048